MCGLSGGSSVNLSLLLEWWEEVDSNSGSRLLLVHDTQHSHKWLPQVRRTPHQYVALQTCYFDTSSPNAADDLETGQGQFQVGVFTNEWMDFNGARINDVNFHDPERCLKSKYAVSRNWTDFTFHLPTETDILQHWKSNFPKFTRPLVSATKINACTSCNCLSCLLRCIKRKRMRWAPPAELATGHGFKLVTS